MNTNPNWTAAVTKAAWTLLLVAVVAFVAWQLLRQLLVPLVVLVALVFILRLAVGVVRRSRWQ